MADINIKGPDQVPLIKYKDMGDSTFAQVVALEPSSIAGGAASAAIVSVQTAATGSAWAAFGAQSCTKLDLINDSAVAIEYRRGGSGNALRIPAGSARMIDAITNANQISVRRVDQSNTQVTLGAEAFA